jgi:bacterioferritin-associated ferredoxin
MYACICAAVEERDIHAAVDQGADTVFAVSCATRAGTGCGSCLDRIEDIIEARTGICPRLTQLVA